MKRCRENLKARHPHLIQRHLFQRAKTGVKSKDQAGSWTSREKSKSPYEDSKCYHFGKKGHIK